MKNKVFILTVLFLMCSISSFCESKISGQVFDPSGNTLPMADVLLYASDGTTQIVGEITDDDGNFLIDGISLDDYVLEVSFMGFKNKRINVSLSEQKPSVRYKKIVLVEDADMLSEVQVSGTRSAMKVDLDKKTYRVNANAIADGTTASEILKEIPSVEVDVEGKVSLRNSENVEIYINGKPAGLTEENRGDILEQMPAGSVQLIEVISNPSSKFDAEGSVGIINIVMKNDEKKNSTYYGSVSAGVIYPWDGRVGGNVGANINYTKNKWNIGSSIGLINRNMVGNGYTNRETYNGDTTFLNQTRGQDADIPSGFFRLGINYAANARNSVNLSGMFSVGGRDNCQDLNYDNGYIVNGVRRSSLVEQRRTETDGLRLMGNVTLDYSHTFRDEGVLSSSVSFLPNKNDNDQTYEQITKHRDDIDSLIGSLRANDYTQYQSTDGHNHTLGIQSDYSKQIKWSDHAGKFETGVKVTFGTQGNVVTSEIQPYGEDERTAQPELGNDFELRQNIYAAYVSYSQKVKRFGMQLGLRGELSDVSWNLYSAGDSEDKKPYGNLFPSAFFSYTFTDKDELQLSYTRRITRPRRYWLNPYVNVSDPANIYFGNPNLDPEITNSTEISYIKNLKKSTFMASLYHKLTQDLVQQYSWIYDDVMWNTRANLATSHAGGLELILKNNFKSVALTYNLNLYYYALKGGVFDVTTVMPGFGVIDKEVVIKDRSNFSWSGQLSADFSLPKAIKLQVSGNYRSPRSTAQGKMLHNYNVNLGLKKSFFSQKLSATLSVRDLLNSRKRRSETWDDSFYQKSEFKFSGRTISLNLAYNFGNLKKNSKGRGKDGNDGSVEEDDDFDF